MERVMKKVQVTVSLVIYVNPDVDVQDVVNEMDYAFEDTTGEAHVADLWITNSEEI